MRLPISAQALAKALELPASIRPAMEQMGVRDLPYEVWRRLPETERAAENPTLGKAFYDPRARAIVTDPSVDPTRSWMRLGVTPTEMEGVLEGGYLGHHEFRHAQQDYYDMLPRAPWEASARLTTRARDAVAGLPPDWTPDVPFVLRAGARLAHDLEPAEIDADATALARAFQDLHGPSQPPLGGLSLYDLALLRVIGGRGRQIPRYALALEGARAPQPRGRAFDEILRDLRGQPELPW